jgi:hypothetical protein
MLLATPLSDDGNTYSWPFIHRIEAPGIYDLDPAYISNITIIKGGDQQQIGQNQALSMVDVRIDFGSLFSSMLATNQPVAKSRPTLKKYLQGMETTKEAFDYKGQKLVNSKVVSSTTVKIPQEIKEKTQVDKTNPSTRFNDAITKSTDTIQLQISNLTAFIKDAKNKLANCQDEDTTCKVSAQNTINRLTNILKTKFGL